MKKMRAVRMNTYAMLIHSIVRISADMWSPIDHRDAESALCEFPCHYRTG
jgi:hypothetical protein